MLHHDDVDDIVQEVFLKVQKALPGFKGEAAVSTWIHRITTNHCIDKIRQEKATKLHELRTKTSVENIGRDRNSDFEKAFFANEMNDCIKHYIHQLPLEFKKVVLLKDIEGYSNKEIAKKLNITIGLTKTRLHRGRLKLKNILTKQCCLYYTEENELACEQK